MKRIPGGLVVMFEGSDGVGKSTQLAKVAEVLEQDGWDVLKTRNLGGTPIGEALRKISFTDIERPPQTDLYISVAIQAALTEAVAAERQKGRIILMDRGPLSLAIYQIYGSGVDEQLGWRYANQGMKLFAPEAIIVYKADIKTALKRARQQSGKADYFESKPISFFERVDRGFDSAAKRFPVTTIDANRSVEVIHADTMKCIRDVLDRKTAKH
jgi:dTMP kinase